MTLLTTVQCVMCGKSFPLTNEQAADRQPDDEYFCPECWAVFLAEHEAEVASWDKSY